MSTSIFADVRMDVAGYAAFMATLISLLLTARQRNRQRARGLPLSPWLTVLPDTLLGTLFGVGLALTIPPNVPMFDNVTGIAFLAGFGGVVGPKVWDLISSDGLSIGLKALAASAAGPLKHLASAAASAAQASPALPEPPLPNPPAPAPSLPASPEVREHDDQPSTAEDPFGQPSSIQPLPDESAQ